MNETTGTPEGLDEKISMLELTQNKIRREATILSLKCNSGMASRAVLDKSRINTPIDLSKFIDSSDI